MTGLPLETFPELEKIGAIRHGFTGRAPGLDVKVQRETALARLDEFHAAARAGLGLGERVFITAEQVHGRDVAIVNADTTSPVAKVDGLITADPRVCLGIYSADCGPVFLVDPARRVIALLHSGRKGTALGIATAAIGKMEREFGCAPADLVAQIGPCIRPPHYEIDFAAEIIAQCRAAGLRQVHDCGTCTGANVARYYSYRLEQGRTGRLLALLALA
jgi:copper oxidase (laccase) domain-containing protein